MVKSFFLLIVAISSISVVTSRVTLGELVGATEDRGVVGGYDWALACDEGKNPPNGGSSSRGSSPDDVDSLVAGGTNVRAMSLLGVSVVGVDVVGSGGSVRCLDDVDPLVAVVTNAFVTSALGVMGGR